MSATLLGIASVIDGAHWHLLVASSLHLPSLDACTLGLHCTDASIHQLTYLRPCRDMVAFKFGYGVGPGRCPVPPLSKTLSKKGGSVPTHRGAHCRFLPNLPDLMNEWCGRDTIPRSEVFPKSRPPDHVRPRTRSSDSQA